MHLASSADFQFQAVLDSHGWGNLLPFRRDASTLWRTHRLPDDRVITLHIMEDNGVHVAYEERLTEAETEALRLDVRRMLCMDWDMRAFYTALQPIERLQWVEPSGAGRMLVSPTVWEDLVKTLLTTNVTWRQTIGMVERLVQIGDTAPDGTHTFPTPRQVAAYTPEALDEQIRAGYRTKSLHKLASSITMGDVDVESWRTLDGASAYKQIKALHGFGDYAAGSILRLLGHHEHLGIDSVARAAFAAVHNAGQKATDATITTFYEPYGPWRGLVMWMDVLSSEE